MTLDTRGALPSAQRVAERIFSTVDRFLQIQALSGVALLVAALAALAWANAAGDHYQQFWRMPLTIGIGGLVYTQPLHFWVNDCLMTVFFLVVGLEIRRELHDGALSTPRMAALPIAAAAGGIIAPAILYLTINTAEPQRHGWGVPTATDIAFAVGVLALLGRSIPHALRVFLLALAVLDDIVGVLIIAVFYSKGIDPSGLAVVGAGVLLTFAFQTIGIGRAWLYLIPGFVTWAGFVGSGLHPTLAGVLLGLITPVTSMRTREPPIKLARRALLELGHRIQATRGDAHAIREPLKQLQEAKRELVPPVVRVQMALHPWVAYSVMPLFALANAGVDLGGIEGADAQRWGITAGVILALVVGKPIGIFTASWLAVRAGWCELPAALSWHSIGIAGCLGGIGFTMSIFIATLAFPQEALLEAAKLGVLVASGVAGTLGLTLGLVNNRRQARETNDTHKQSTTDKHVAGAS